MNSVQMQQRVMFLIDRTRSPRWRTEEKSNAINMAIDLFFYDRYNNIKQQKFYSFQFIQRVRDDLRTLVKVLPIAPVGNIVAYPSDYRHEISFDAIIDGAQVSSRAITYNELRIAAKNSFQEPTPQYPVHYEDQNGINVGFGGSGIFSSGIVTYLKTPVQVFVSDVPIVAGPAVLIVGQTYYVTIGTVTHNTIVYSVGQTFVAVNTALTGTGTVINIVNCDLPDHTHEEICKLAGYVLTNTVDQWQKSQSLEREANKA